MSRAHIRYTIDSNHFGSGYASYIQLFRYRDEFVTITETNGEKKEERIGLNVLVSRLAPVIAIGGNAWEFTYVDASGKRVGGSHSMLDDPNELHIDKKFQELYNDLVRLFMKYQFTLLQKEDVDAPLSFAANIPTLSRRKGQYIVWDAIFYWED